MHALQVFEVVFGNQLEHFLQVGLEFWEGHKLSVSHSDVFSTIRPMAYRFQGNSTNGLTCGSLG
jgi:hypothetical protein